MIVQVHRFLADILPAKEHRMGQTLVFKEWIAIMAKPL